MKPKNSSDSWGEENGSRPAEDTSNNSRATMIIQVQHNLLASMDEHTLAKTKDEEHTESPILQKIKA